MKKTKFTLLAQTILQIEAGTHEGIRDGGNLYILIQQEEGVDSGNAPTKQLVTDDVADAPAPSRGRASAPAQAPAKAVAQASNEGGSEDWTEEEMKGMDSQDLLDECHALGIDPDKSGGRNTNKKLRDLILDYHANGADVIDDAEEEALAPKASARGRKVEPAPAPAEAEADLELIPEDEWETLKPGDLANARLNVEGEDGEKIWEVEIVGWKKPAGSKTDKLFILFAEDGLEDYLREGDELFEFQEEI